MTSPLETTRGSNKTVQDPDTPIVSVIIPSYNDAEVLGVCLQALMDQDIAKHKYEIIVVDDGSTDNTKELVATFQDKSQSLFYYYQDNQGPAAARNFGAFKATGSIIMFTDADCEPKTDWIAQMLKPFERDAEVAGVKGAYRTRQKSCVAQFAQNEFMYRYRKMLKSDQIDFVDTYAAAFNKKKFLSLKGFDTSFPCANNEDVEFSYRMAAAGHKMVFNPEAIVYHRHPDTIFEYLRLKFGRAYWRMAVYERFPGKIKSDSYTPQTLKVQIVSAYLLLLSLVLFFTHKDHQTLSVSITAIVFFFSTFPFLVTVINSKKIYKLIELFQSVLKKGFIRNILRKIKSYFPANFFSIVLSSIFNYIRKFFHNTIKILKIVIFSKIIILTCNIILIISRSIINFTYFLTKRFKLIIITSINKIRAIITSILRSVIFKKIELLFQTICSSKIVMIPVSVIIIFLQGIVMGLGILWGLQPKRSTKNRFTQFLVFLFVDILSLLLAILFVYCIKQYVAPVWFGDTELPLLHYKLVPFFVVSLILIYLMIGLYKPSHGFAQVNEFVLLVKSTLTAGVVTCILFFLIDIDFSYPLIALLVTATIIFVNIGRGFARKLSSRLSNEHGQHIKTHILIVGTGEIAQLICKRFATIKYVDSTIVGFVSDNGLNSHAYPGDMLLNHKILGGLDDLARIINEKNIHEVFVALPLMPQRDVITLIDKHSAREGVHFHIITNMFDLISAEVNIAEQKNIPITYLKNERMMLLHQFLKRIFDIVVALIIVVFTFPFWFLIIIAIKVETDGPAFFLQERVGKDGKIFNIYKFRTMYNDTDKYQLSPSGYGDSRITKIGRLLRKTSLDELPQFINILKGDMSLVGPRPEMPFIVDKYEEWERRRLTIRPGLTGLWQIMGRKDLPLHENLEYDFYYIKNPSLVLDLVILMKTLPIVLQGKGAY